MTMFIDSQGADADGKGSSADLIEPMKALGIPVVEQMLKSADVKFTGRGVEGEPLLVGVEYKKLPDYIASMKGRMQAEQLPKMLRHYDRRYLIIEGDINHDAQGRLIRRAGRRFWKPIPGAPPAAEVIKRMLVMELRGGLSTYITTSLRQTCLFLMALYRVWTDKDMDEHKSHLALSAPDLDARLTEDISWFRDACGRLPGVGFMRSKSFEEEFGDIDTLLEASVEEIASVSTNGRVLGRSTAERIYKTLHTRRKR